MIQLSKFFKSTTSSKKDHENGLCASLDSLMYMRRYVPFVKAKRNWRSSSIDSGEFKSAFRSRGIEMEEVREYQFGDDIRDIDWRVTARMGEAYTKVYTAEKNREIYVWLDLSAIMLFGSKVELKSVTAAKLAALLGWLALDNKDRFGCVIFDGQQTWCLPAKSDRSYISAICKKIAQVSSATLDNPENQKNARLKSLKQLIKYTGKEKGVFIISSFLYWDEDYQPDLAYLSKENNLFLLNIYDQLEATAPISGQYMAQYNNEKLIFDTTDKDYVKNYHTYFAHKNKELHHRYRGLGCHVIDIANNFNLINDLKLF